MALKSFQQGVQFVRSGVIGPEFKVRWDLHFTNGCYLGGRGLFF